MAQGKTKIPAHAGCGHTCGECIILILNNENRNYKGEPFFGYCIHGRVAFSRRVNLGVTYVDTPACEYFSAGERPSWITKGGMV